MRKFGVLLVLAGSLMAQASRPTAPTVAFDVHADRTVGFHLRAPQASTVQLAGDFGSTVPMTKTADGTWTAQIGPLRPAIYSYAFLVDGVRALDAVNTWVGTADRGPGASQFEVKGDAANSWDPQNVPHGTVHVHYYNSKKFDGALRTIYVYTPPGYEHSNARYPALYLMHGAAYTDSSWVAVGRANMILDNLIAAGKAKPMIVVMPYGRPGGSPSLDPMTPPIGPSPPGEAVFPNDMVEDVVPFAEKTYRIAANADQRAIAGQSMGGNQTLLVGLNHLDLFHWVGAFSPVIYAKTMEADYQSALTDASATNKKLKLLRTYCGSEDTLFQVNKDFHALLDQKGLRNTFTESGGAHVWANWRDYFTDLVPRLFQ